MLANKKAGNIFCHNGGKKYLDTVNIIQELLYVVNKTDFNHSASSCSNQYIMPRIIYLIA